MKKFLISTAALAASGTVAFAGGPTAPVVEPVIAPVAQPVRTIGDWQGGYIGLSANYGRSQMSTLPGSRTGWGAALRGGYDWQVDRAVLGVGAEYDFGKSEDATAMLDRTGTIFARAGYDAGPVLPYVLAGYSWSKASAGGATDSVSGPTIGLGAEYRFAPGWSAFGEATYTSFGRATALAGNPRVVERGVKVGVNFRF